MEPEGLLSCSQEPATCPYRESYECGPQLPTLFAVSTCIDLPYQLITRCRIFLDKFVVTQLVKKLPVLMETESSFPCSQKPAFGRCPEPLECIPLLHTPFLLISVSVVYFHIHQSHATGLFP